MALFSSIQAAQTISAPPLPVLTEELPRIIFSGPDCRTVTVTLESTTTYKKNQFEDIKVRMLKIYTVNSATPQKINIEVEVEILTVSQFGQQVSQPLATLFKLDVDPHLRDGRYIGNRRNYPFFKGCSAQHEDETDPTWYEAYTLPLRLINTRPTETYYYNNTPHPDNPADYLGSYLILVEFNRHTSSWSFLTLSSLLSDLLEKCPPFFLQLYIVGNHQIVSNNPNVPPIEVTLDREGRKFAFAPTGFTDPVEVEDAKWDQFLLARATSMKKFIFGTRELGVKLLPAIKIKTDASGTEEVVWNELANLFQLPDGSPDIARLKQLNLQKGRFPAGSIFLWISLNLFDVEVLFQLDQDIVYPTIGEDWQNYSANNLKKINKLRQTVAFFTSSGVSNDFVTNLTDVKLRVEGHTDRSGDEDFNLDLSKRRAAAVIHELVNPSKPLPGGVTAGIGSDKFSPEEGEGYGETRPFIRTPDGKKEERNRRVLVRVVSVVCPPP